MHVHDKGINRHTPLVVFRTFFSSLLHLHTEELYLSPLNNFIGQEEQNLYHCHHHHHVILICIVTHEKSANSQRCPYTGCPTLSIPHKVFQHVLSICIDGFSLYMNKSGMRFISFSLPSKFSCHDGDYHFRNGG